MHRDTLVATPRSWSSDRLAVSVVEELAELGPMHTAALLRGHLSDPDLGSPAVRAIRAIEENRRDRGEQEVAPTPGRMPGRAAAG